MLLIDYPKVAAIRPQGSLGGSKALELDKELRTVLAKDDVSVLLLDLQHVESLDCSGLMALVSALKLAQTKGKRFSLCCVSPSLKMIFEMTQLDTVFEIFDCEAEFEATCESVSVKEAALVCA